MLQQGTTAVAAASSGVEWNDILVETAGLGMRGGANPLFVVGLRSYSNTIQL